VNGKTKIVEQAFEMTSSKTGYSAIYYYNSTNQYQLAASVLGLSNGSLTVDVELPSTEWLNELRLSDLWIADDKLTVTTRAKLHGSRYVVSARCVTLNTMITLEGAETYPFDWRGAPTKECTAYMIQGLPWSDVRPLLAPGFAWQWVFVITCALKLLAMAGVTYKAYIPFRYVTVFA
jgi:hypothetical protein